MRLVDDGLLVAFSPYKSEILLPPDLQAFSASLVGDYALVGGQDRDSQTAQYLRQLFFIYIDTKAGLEILFSPVMIFSFLSAPYFSAMRIVL